MGALDGRVRARAAVSALALVACFAAMATACGGGSSSGGARQDSGPTDSTSPESSSACVPGASVACAGPGGCAGYQVCNQSGSGFEACECGVEGGRDAEMPVSDGPTDSNAIDVSDGNVDAWPDSSLGDEPASDGPGVDGGTGGGQIDSGSEGGQIDGGPVYLCGSKAFGPVTDAGTSTLLTSIGLQYDVAALLKDGDYVAGSDGYGWMLWNAASGLEIADGLSGTPVGLANGHLAINNAGQAQLISATDGSTLAAISAPGVTAVGLANDGSYFWATSTYGLSVWSPAGITVAWQSGNYSGASVFGVPGHLLVANGPAGANVIQDVAADGSNMTTNSPSFSGTFASWFKDGTKFLTTLGNNIFVYTSSASQVQLVPVSAVGPVGGSGAYFWNYHGFPANLDLYAVGGNGQPVKTYTGNGYHDPVGSVHLLAIFPSGPSGLTLVNLDATPLTDQFVTLPSWYAGSFAGDENGFWAIGGRDQGFVYYVGTASAPAQSGPLGCGELMAMAGSPSGVAAIATASGLLIADTSAGTLAGVPVVVRGPNLYVSYRNQGVKLSSDGHSGAVASADSSLDILQWPAWSVADSLPSAGVDFGFDLSLDATTLARTVVTNAGSTYQSSVTDVSGSTSIWSVPPTPCGSGGCVAPVPLLSPNGDHFAVTDVMRSSSSATRLYNAGVLTSAVAGSAVGWLDEGHLLLQTYVTQVGMVGSITVYSGTLIVDPTGTVLSSPPLPEITSFDAITPTIVFSHEDQKLYDVTSGAVISGTGLGPHSVAAGPFIVSLAGHSLLATRY